MSSKCYSAAVEGISARIVEVEVTIRGGSPKVIIVGLPDPAVRESRDRVRTALEASGYRFPTDRKVLVNLAPASRRKVGPVYDLPIALGILAERGMLPAARLARYVVLGELALDGRVRAIRGALPVAMRVSRTPGRALLLPAANAREAGIYPGVRVLPVNTLTEAADHLAGLADIEPVTTAPEEVLSCPLADAPDLSDVRGQDLARRALEVAAAGSHNLLMVGPPGTGKTMLARRLPSILPPLTLREALETTTVHSVAGELGEANIVAARPFRAPHHSISMAGLLGGGPDARPGEASLSHHGVLFLDELPEFDRRTLDALRQPLEEGRVRISRVGYSVRYPARFALVAAMNPCRCGMHGTDEVACSCSPSQVLRYRARVSGPLLDRIDLHLPVPKLTWTELARETTGEESAPVRDRVLAARELQARRLGAAQTNASMRSTDVRRHCVLDPSSTRLLRDAVERLGLSGRGHDRVLRVARTIADLGARERIDEGHLAEALQYRSTAPREASGLVG